MAEAVTLTPGLDYRVCEMCGNRIYFNGIFSKWVHGSVDVGRDKAKQLDVDHTATPAPVVVTQPQVGEAEQADEAKPGFCANCPDPQACAAGGCLAARAAEQETPVRTISADEALATQVPNVKVKDVETGAIFTACAGCPDPILCAENGCAAAASNGTDSTPEKEMDAMQKELVGNVMELADRLSANLSREQKERVIAAARQGTSMLKGILDGGGNGASKTTDQVDEIDMTEDDGIDILINGTPLMTVTTVGPNAFEVLVSKDAKVSLVTR